MRLQRTRSFIAAMLIGLAVVLTMSVLAVPYARLLAALSGYALWAALFVAALRPEGAFSRWILSPEAKHQLSDSQWLRQRRSLLRYGSLALWIASVDIILAGYELSSHRLDSTWAKAIEGTTALCLFFGTIAFLTKKWREA